MHYPGRKPTIWLQPTLLHKSSQAAADGKQTNLRQVDFKKWIFWVKMRRLCTAGGFEVIPEQAQQYDLLKFYDFVVHCFRALDGTVIHYSIM